MTACHKPKAWTTVYILILILWQHVRGRNILDILSVNLSTVPPEFIRDVTHSRALKNLQNDVQLAVRAMWDSRVASDPVAIVLSRFGNLQFPIPDTGRSSWSILDLLGKTLDSCCSVSFSTGHTNRFYVVVDGLDDLNLKSYMPDTSRPCNSKSTLSPSHFNKLPFNCGFKKGCTSSWQCFSCSSKYFENMDHTMIPFVSSQPLADGGYGRVDRVELRSDSDFPMSDCFISCLNVWETKVWLHLYTSNDA
jgi:hypothetical protein